MCRVPGTLPPSACASSRRGRARHWHPPCDPPSRRRLHGFTASRLHGFVSAGRPPRLTGSCSSQEIRHRGSSLIFQEKPEVQVLKGNLPILKLWQQIHIKQNKHCGLKLLGDRAWLVLGGLAVAAAPLGPCPPAEAWAHPLPLTPSACCARHWTGCGQRPRGAAPTPVG